MAITAHRETPAERGRLRRLWPLGLLLAGLAVALALGLHRHLTLEALAAQRETLARFVAEDGALAAAAYVGLYALTVAFSVPGGTVLTLAGGFLFGTLAGAAFAVAGATLGAVAVFLAARSAFGGLLRAKAGPWVGRLEGGFREHAFNYMLFLRLVPLFPFWLVNLVPAVLGVPLRVYTLATLIGIVPGGLVYASVGNGLGAVLDAGGRPDLGLIFAPEVLLPLLGLGALALLPVLARRLKTGKREG